jgi:hypothetical protein
VFVCPQEVESIVMIRNASVENFWRMGAMPSSTIVLRGVSMPSVKADPSLRARAARAAQDDNGCRYEKSEPVILSEAKDLLLTHWSPPCISWSRDVRALVLIAGPLSALASATARSLRSSDANESGSFAPAALRITARRPAS